MSKKIKEILEYSKHDLEQLHLEKCEYCRGKDGKNKDIYKTLEYAMDTIKYLEKERNIYLNPYICPYGNGYHLTKNNADTEIEKRNEEILQNNDIPLKSSSQSNISWEYEKEGDEIIEEKMIRTGVKYIQKEDPIKKVLPDENVKINMLEGKVIEIIDKIDIGKYFSVNIENQFVVSLLKDLLKNTMSQITIYTGTENKNIQNSYTVFIDNGILKQNRIIRGKIIKINLKYKKINNIKIWYANKIIK
jgi:hypothetical protein